MRINTILFPAAALLLALVFVACTHKPIHPTKTDREWTADHQACETRAREMIRDEPDSFDNLDEMKMIKICMQRKGWTWERSDWFRFGNGDRE